MVEEVAEQSGGTSKKISRREFLEEVVRKGAKVAGAGVAGGALIVGGGSRARPGGVEPTTVSDVGKAILKHVVDRRNLRLEAAKQRELESQRVRLPLVLYPSEYAVQRKRLIYANDRTNIWEESVPRKFDLGRRVIERISDTSEVVTTTGKGEKRHLLVDNQDGNSAVMFAIDIDSFAEGTTGLELALWETDEEGNEVAVASRTLSSVDIEYIKEHHRGHQIEFFLLPNFASMEGEELNWDRVGEKYFNALPYSQEPSNRLFGWQRNVKLGERKDPVLQIKVTGKGEQLSSDRIPLFSQEDFTSEVY